MVDELQQRFDALRPELEARAQALVGALPEPRPRPTDLVDATWRVMASRRSKDITAATAMRELECAGHNLIIRERMRGGDPRGAFEYLLPHLQTWATNLTNGVKPPRPDPHDIAQAAVEKLLRAPMFAAVDNPLGYAFRAVKNLVLDHVRRPGIKTAPIDDRKLPTVEQSTSPERLDEIMRRAQLSPEERCMLFQVVFEQLAVSAAQKHCNGPAGAPYYVLEKIYDKVAASLGMERSR